MKTTKHYVTSERTVPVSIRNQIPEMPGSNRFYKELYKAIEMKIGEFAASLDSGQEYLTNFVQDEFNKIATYTLRVLPDSITMTDPDYLASPFGIELKVQYFDILSSRIRIVIDEFGFVELKKIPITEDPEDPVTC